MVSHRILNLVLYAKVSFPGNASGREPTCQCRQTWGTWVPPLGREDLLAEGTATHSSTLAWRIPWTEEPGRLQSIGLQTARHNWSGLACMPCDPMDCRAPGLPVLHHLTELAQTHVHWVGDAIQPSHPLLSPSPPAFNLFQHQGLCQWVSSSHQVSEILEFQHQSFQWILRTDLL